MIRTLSLYLVLLFFLVPSLDASAKSNMEPWIQRYQIKSESVRDSKAKSYVIQAEATYSADPEIVCAVLEKYDRILKILPKTKKTELLSREDDTAKVKIELKLPWPLPDLWNDLNVRRVGDNCVHEWTLEKGNVKRHNGRVEIEKLSKGTKLKMKVDLDPSFWLIPQRLVAWSINKFFPKTLIRFGSLVSGEERKRRIARIKKEGKKLPMEALKEKYRLNFQGLRKHLGRSIPKQPNPDTPR